MTFTVELLLTEIAQILILFSYQTQIWEIIMFVNDYYGRMWERES